MNDDQFNVIMSELKELRSESRTNGERLARVETQVKMVVGNGRAGRLDILEGRIDSLSAWRWRVVGICGGVSGVCTVLGYLIFHK